MKTIGEYRPLDSLDNIKATATELLRANPEQFANVHLFWLLREAFELGEKKGRENMRNRMLEAVDGVR